jgi:hypothetical protein
MNYTYNDGGRKAATGRIGLANDCVVRAIAIAGQYDYAQVHADIQSQLRNSVDRYGVPKRIYQPYLKAKGWTWVPLMGIGTGCRYHLRADELPKGRIIARCSRHLVAVIDGIIHDTHNPARGGTRAVYGYWIQK